MLSAETAKIVLNYVILCLLNTSMFLAVFGPLLFDVAFRKTQIEARKILDGEAQQQVALNGLLEKIAGAEEGKPEYALMEFSIHYYTMIAALASLVIGSWGVVFASFARPQLDGENALGLNLLIYAIVVTLGSIIFLLSAYCGRIETLRTYLVPRSSRTTVFSIMFPPLNILSIARAVVAIISFCYLILRIELFDGGFF